jgi:metalloprotease
MLKFLPLILPIVYGLLMYHFSAWRTRAMLTANSHPLTDPAILAVTARLARALDVPRIPVQVFNIDPVNGLAAPDGRIFLTRGFMAKHADGSVTPDELASVIAHELGHVALGHTRRRMIDFTGQNAAFVMLSAVLGRIVPLAGIWIANLLTTAVAARLSRRDEFEADAYASALLIKSGIGTGPQKTLFAKLGGLTGAKTSAPAWLRSHPHTDERIAAINANESKWMG